VVLQDLTEYITKTGDYPVARGGFGEIWKCTYQTDRGPIPVRTISFLPTCAKLKIRQVAVKSLLVYTSDQLGGAMEKKTKVGTLMKVCFLIMIMSIILQRIRREIRTCARLKHHNILSVYGYTYGFGLFMAIVSPWAENGNLTTYLERENACLTVARRFQIVSLVIHCKWLTNDTRSFEILLKACTTVRIKFEYKFFQLDP
jgi:serine/threonine protein kinase